MLNSAIEMDHISLWYEIAVHSSDLTYSKMRFSSAQYVHMEMFHCMRIYDSWIIFQQNHRNKDF